MHCVNPRAQTKDWKQIHKSKEGALHWSPYGSPRVLCMEGDPVWMSSPKAVHLRKVNNEGTQR